MMKNRVKFKNLGALLTYRKARKLRDVSAWKNIFSNLTTDFDWLNERDGRRKHPAERIIWFTIYIIAILGTLSMITDFTLTYKRSPTVTIPESHPVPIQNVDFPAVAICNVNRISQKAAIDFAQELVELETIKFAANLTVPDVMRMLHLMGRLYLHEFKDADTERTKQLHAILERTYNGYDVCKIMKRLSPKCRSMLRKCSWKGKDVACDDIFVLRKTQDGYCCTFNYGRRNDEFASKKYVFASQRIERMTNIGSEYGLSVLIQPQLDDYFFKILPINGFKVLIYNPLDYPDVPSGQVHQILLSPKTETYVNLDAVLFYTTKDVEGYDIEERDCLFQTEQSKILDNYSFSDCLVACRIRDIHRLCGCVPFFYPSPINITYWRVCNLKDLSCLRKYRVRWRNVKPRFEHAMIPFDDSKVEESSGYLNCDCFPSCTDVTYHLQFSSIPLSLTELSWGRGKYSIKNDSVLHIYFDKIEVIRLRQDVVYYWYELISHYGGVCSLFLGVSIIKVIEILYIIIKRIYYSVNQPAASQVKEEIKKHRSTTVTTIAVEPIRMPQVDQPLHWGELTGSVRKEQLNPSNLLLNPLLKQ